MEGAPHTAKKQLLCFGVPPPPYIKEEREEAGPRGRAKEGESSS